MTKKPRYTRKRDVRRAATVKDTAEIMKISPRQVQLVLAGNRNNDKVLEVFMELTEGHSALIEEVKKLVPFK